MVIRCLYSSEWSRALGYLYAHLDPAARNEAIATDVARLKTEPALKESFFGIFSDHEHADGELFAVMLAETQPGEVVQFRMPAFTEATNDNATKINAGCQLLEKLEEFARSRGCSWLQTLVDPSRDLGTVSLQQRGFSQLAVMSYQLCTAEHFPKSLPKTVLRMRTHQELSANDQQDVMTQVVELTYEQTLDCPAMQNQRSIEQIIAGYHAVGDSGTQYWWIAELENEPVGCLLLAKHESERAKQNRGEEITDSMDRPWCELMYWGIVPGFRHRGLGAELLKFGLAQARTMNADKFILAVDSQNHPALKIYERFGFIEWLQQAIWTKSL